ncbi:MAG: protein translocase subunit SecDF [Flavobacteriales bacterium]
MQNKNAVLIFTSLLILATLYTLSFNWVANRFERVAAEHGAYVADSLVSAGVVQESAREEAARKAAREFLRDSANAEIYPVFGHTYQEVVEQELNLGLDLQGGMSVTLEVSVPDLIVALSDYSTNPKFQAAIAEARSSRSEAAGAEFVDLFAGAWSKQDAEGELWRIFHNLENKDLFPAKASDAEIVDILRNEAETAIANTESIIRKRIDQLGVAQPNVQRVSGGRILVELPGIDDRERARKQLKATANLEFWETWFNDEIFQRVADANTAVGKSLRPDLYGLSGTPAVVDTTAAAADSTATADTAADSLASAESGEAKPDSALTLDDRRAKNPLFAYLQPETSRRGAVVGYTAVADTARVNSLLNRAEARAALGPDVRLLWDAKPTQGVAQLYAIRDDSGKGKAKLTGRSIVDARVSYDEVGDVVVSMTMDSEGAGVWGTMTQACAADNQRAVAIVLDGLVFSAPNVQSAITNGRSQISFGSGQALEAKLKEAEDLAGLLKAGSLPAPARIVDETSIGAQLGEDNITAGLWSFAIALAVVLIYMIVYYKGAGVVANVALIANLFFLVGALASLGAALTLPGIAGIVLTIGMAVDANVLVYERIREELRNGKSLSQSIKEGYSGAYSSIIDANITTLLTAVVLYSFGTGSVRGFATTLIAGIFTSLFSAIVISRLIIFSRLERKKPISFSSNLTEKWFTGMSFDFLGRRKIFYAASGLVIAVGLGSLVTRGLNYGVEFSGGSTFDVTFEQPVDVDAVRTALSDAFTEDGTKGNPLVQTKDSDMKLRIMTNYLTGKDVENQDEQILGALNAGLTSVGAKYTVDQYNKVDATVSDDFRSGARNATLGALIVIFAYIVFRFRKWQFGLGALAALIHDVLMVLTMFTLLQGILPFSLEIDQAFIAAILTVIGYSINDTVVVFDRIREYLAGSGSREIRAETLNGAMNNTLGRTINTSMTTLVVLLTIFLLGGDNIKGFVFALLVGIFVGTYSSLCIATPLVFDLSKKKATA